MTRKQCLNISSRRYDALIGVGGMGFGQFFALDGNHTLGREESRSGRFMDRCDYCKLHIISHYVHTLLGTDFASYPIGRLGKDEPGDRILREVQNIGMDTRFIEQAEGEQTLFSFCFIYPDGSGGNLTTNNSASGNITTADVAQTEKIFEEYSRRGIALAVPEAPLDSRMALLQLAVRYGFFRAVSYTVGEILQLTHKDLANHADFIAVNINEAAAIAGMDASKHDPSNIARQSVQCISEYNPDVMLSITAGKYGSWTWDGSILDHRVVCTTNTVSTAGAGDAHMAGIIVGLSAGLALADAHELATLVASMSTTSQHTIHPDINKISLRNFADSTGITLCDNVRNLLK